MKAQEYFDKFMLNIKTNEELKKRLDDMFHAFLDETEELIKTRNIKTSYGLEGVVRTMNEKWNSVAAKAEQLYGKPVVKRNAFWNVFLSDWDPKRFPPRP